MGKIRKKLIPPEVVPPQVVIATKNPDKFREIKTILNGLPVEFHNLGNISLPKEVGRSLTENAILKAETSLKFTHTISIADDTGLEVDTLNGLPGVYSSRFAGPNASYEENRKKLLMLLGARPINERKAKFRCVVAIAQQEEQTKVFEGEIEGYITYEERGNSGFGYDSIFMVPELGKTLAEITSNEKNKISHRALALLKAKKYLKKQLLINFDI